MYEVPFGVNVSNMIGSKYSDLHNKWINLVTVIWKRYRLVRRYAFGYKQMTRHVSFRT